MHRYIPALVQDWLLHWERQRPPEEELQEWAREVQTWPQADQEAMAALCRAGWAYKCTEQELRALCTRHYAESIVAACMRASADACLAYAGLLAAPLGHQKWAPAPELEDLHQVLHQGSDLKSILEKGPPREWLFLLFRAGLRPLTLKKLEILVRGQELKEPAALAGANGKPQPLKQMTLQALYLRPADALRQEWELTVGRTKNKQTQPLARIRVRAGTEAALVLEQWYALPGLERSGPVKVLPAEYKALVAFEGEVKAPRTRAGFQLAQARVLDLRGSGAAK